MDEIGEPNKELKDALDTLRHRVENPNQFPGVQLIGGVYRSKKPSEMMVLTYPPWAIGYRVIPKGNNGTFVRQINIKVQNAKLSEVPHDEAEPIMLAIFDSLLDNQAGEVVFCANLPDGRPLPDDLMIIEQEFMPMFLMEKKPGLVRL